MPARSRPEPPAPIHHDCVTVAVGALTRDPEWRELPSGTVVLSFDLAVRAGHRAAESVPVAWADPPSRTRLGVDDEVVMLGRTRRRFFRSAGATASRTEIVAERVVPVRQRARCAAVLAEAAARLDEVAAGVPGGA